jgi:hypothetical protein
MGLSIWSEEGNTQDLSFWFLPPKEQETAGQAKDTPSYLDETRYVQAKTAQPPAPAFNFMPILLLVGILLALGVIKL